jgi:iron complex transport system ATP-binding protein
MDEPSASLDPRHRFLLAQRIRARVADGAAAIFSTHELDMAAAAADDVVLLRRGEVVAFGPASEVLTGEALGELFGVPAHVVPGPSGRPAVLLG